MFWNANHPKEDKYIGYPKRIIPANDVLFNPLKPGGMVERAGKRWTVPSYTTNFVRTTKYTILDFLPKTLFDQFRRAANFYFLVQMNCVTCVAQDQTRFILRRRCR